MIASPLWDRISSPCGIVAVHIVGFGLGVTHPAKLVISVADRIRANVFDVLLIVGPLLLDLLFANSV